MFFANNKKYFRDQKVKWDWLDLPEEQGHPDYQESKATRATTEKESKETG